jgi:acyl-CoA thioesterase-2
MSGGLQENTGDIGELLALEQLDDDLFRNRVNDVNRNGALFGGQVLGQALHAAVRSVPGRPPHSLHAYFVRAGDMARPVVYAVERTRDGGSFSTRRITANQHGVPILHMEASFHAGDPGWDHGVGPAQDAPDPDTLLTLGELGQAHPERLEGLLGRRFGVFRTLEVKPTDPERQVFSGAALARSAFWVRIPSAATLAPELHACALAYASDSGLASAASRIHLAPEELGRMQMASLDHAMWFHGPVRADAWSLYEIDSPWTGQGRGLARGQIFDRDRRLIASTAQEALLRRRRDAGP